MLVMISESRDFDIEVLQQNFLLTIKKTISKDLVSTFGVDQSTDLILAGSGSGARWVSAWS